MSYYLTTDRLTKLYKNYPAVEDVSLHVEEGSIYVLAGKTGAGKSTLLKMIARQLTPSSGMLAFSEDMSKTGPGVLIEEPGLFPNLTGLQNLELKRRAFLNDSHERLRQLLDFAGLSSWGGVKVKSYSAGMRRRLGLCMALIGDPRFLILDEPMYSMDTQSISDFKIMLRSLNEQGKTILLSTSSMKDLINTADTVGILENGKLREEKSIAEIKKSLLTHIRINAGPLYKVREVLEKRGIYSYQVPDEGTVLLMERLNEIDDIIEDLKKNEVDVTSFYPMYDPPEAYFGNILGEVRA